MRTRSDRPSHISLGGTLMTIQTDQPAPVNGAPQPNERMTPPEKLRRRPMLWVLGIALMCLGGILAAFVTTAIGNTSKVVALRNDVDRGSVIQQGDLMTMEISGDPSLQTVPASEEASLVGKYAVRDLTAGSLLPPDAVDSQVIPGKGDALVGVALTPAQLPATPLRSGSEVVILSTPKAQDDLPSTAPATVKATVVGVSRNSDTTQVVVDVTVPADQATQLAQMVATGRIALIVDGAP